LLGFWALTFLLAPALVRISAAQVQPLLTAPVPGQLPSDADRDARERVVVGVGRSTIYAGDANSARETALRAAYADAVAQGAGVNVGSLTIVTNMKAITDVVVSKTTGRITAFEILGEGTLPTNTSTYELRIRATVVANQLTEEDDREALRLYLQILGQPRVLVILPQYTSAVPEPATPPSVSASTTSARVGDVSLSASEVEVKGATAGTPVPPSLLEVSAGAARSPEYALAQALSAYGYQVVTSDDLVATGEISLALLTEARRGITTAAAELARRADVDLVLFGIVQLTTSRIRPAGVEFVSATVEASGKALIVSSGLLVQAFHRTSTRAHQNALAASASALERIGTDIAAALAWKIPSLLVENLRQTTIVLEGASLSMADAVKSCLSDLAFVETVTIDRLPTKDAPQATLRLQTGFIRADAREILAVIEAKLGQGRVQLLNQDRFELRFQLQ